MAGLQHRRESGVEPLPRETRPEVRRLRSSRQWKVIPLPWLGIDTPWLDSEVLGRVGRPGLRQGRTG